MRLFTRILLLMSIFSFLGCGSKTPAAGLGPELDADVHLKSIYYSATHGYYAYSNIGYKAERLESGSTKVIVEVGNDRDRVFEAEGSLMDSLEAIVREYRMQNFKGHYDPKMEVLDGDSWSMELVFTDGSSSSCGGYMAYPPNGAAGIHKTEALLSRWLIQEPAEETGLVSFRYEYHDAEGSEIYTLQKKDTLYSVFIKPYGQAKGETYDGLDDLLAKRTASEIRWNHMASYTGENPADEDTSRPRWILKAEYENGQKIETMDYLDRPEEDRWSNNIPSRSEIAMRNSTQQDFSEAVKRLKEND